LKHLTFILLVGIAIPIVLIGQGCDSFKGDNTAEPSNRDLLPEDPVINVDASSSELTEGGGPISVTINRDGVDGTEPVQVSLVPEGGALASSFVIEPSTLSLSSVEPSVTISVRLKIGPLPFKDQQTKIFVNTDYQGRTEQQEVLLDILPVQAPNIFLLIGQSNMEGSSLRRADAPTQQDAKDAGPGGLDEPHPKIFQLNVHSNNFNDFATTEEFVIVEKNVLEPLIIQAEDPLHVNGKSDTNIGPGLTFAKAVLDITDQDIVLVPAAFGSTGFCTLAPFPLYGWNSLPTGDPDFQGTGLFARAVLRTNIALEATQGVLRGILWQQGERDEITQACSDKYKDNLTLLFSQLRSQIDVDLRGEEARGASSDVPIIVGTNSRGNDNRGDFSQLNAFRTKVYEAQTTVSTYVPHSGTSIHDDLVPPDYPCGSGSCVHFGAKAYREMGRRYFEVYKTLGSSDL